ncbi:MAG: hypothetical protein WBC70_07835 [Candidatus Aminicenantales bacterium]
MYLWGDEDGTLTAGRHALEGEWLSLPFGRVVYPDEAVKRAAFFFDARRDAARTGDASFAASVEPGHYSFRIRASIDSPASGRILGLSFWTAKGREPLRSLLISGSDFASPGTYREFEVTVPVTAPGPLRLAAQIIGAAGKETRDAESDREGVAGGTDKRPLHDLSVLFAADLAQTRVTAGAHRADEIAELAGLHGRWDAVLWPERRAGSRAPMNGELEHFPRLGDGDRRPVWKTVHTGCRLRRSARETVS